MTTTDDTLTLRALDATRDYILAKRAYNATVKMRGDMMVTQEEVTLKAQAWDIAERTMRVAVKAAVDGGGR